ncbi:hypothetical protein EA472_09575 [Natrarchaeobius oligotrophus]|uniref:Uncharacterized protein n=1 Tax=Natrarchaeobius chitinivorans TaxID=1679083 RepID=A0A3N6PP09_NATCH|nr:hypothetical protein EA472_09575 [Natrarchaeobius chitinivorans]
MANSRDSSRGLAAVLGRRPAIRASLAVLDRTGSFQSRRASPADSVARACHRSVLVVFEDERPVLLDPLAVDFDERISPNFFPGPRSRRSLGPGQKLR